MSVREFRYTPDPKGNVTLPAGGWTPRWYQLPLWRYFEDGGRNAVAVWPRRHGKDITAMNILATKSQERVGLYWIVYPQLKQGRSVAWNGMDKHGRRFRDAFPKDLIVSETKDDMRLTLANGSVWQVMGADHPDSWRGANPIGIVYSEYPWMDPDAPRIVAPILAENDGWQLFIYTPFGKNHGHALYKQAQGKSDWFCDLKTAADLRVLSPERLRSERESYMRDMGDDHMFQQEYMSSFEAPISGSYYGPLMERAFKEGRITKLVYVPRIPVYTSWDIGFGDHTAIWFFQIVGGRINVIDYYEDKGKGMSHYIKFVTEWKDAHQAIFAKHFGPHDLEHGEWTTGKTRWDVARQAGLRFTVVPKHLIDDGIESVRNLLPMVAFDADQCSRGIEALKSYTKEYDSLKRVFKPQPLHDWSSHAADAFRYFAMGCRQTPDIRGGGESLWLPDRFRGVKEVVEFDPRDA